MNQKIWKQYDTRWASKPYPKARVSTVGGCGCGLLACTHVAMEQERYKNWTPDNLRTWMVSKGFAVVGQGTRWEGITETLKHIGHKKVVKVYDDDPMSEAWKELDKGNRIGVILFNGKRAHRFTTNGHYIAFTGYKVKNGEHYFYLKDSGGRGNSGWKSYSYCKGCISKMWIVKRVGKQVKTPVIKASTYKPSKPYTGKLPTSTVRHGSKGDDAKSLQKFLNWCIGTKLGVDGIIGDASETAIKVFQKTYGLTVDGIFGNASKAKAQSIVKKYAPKKAEPKKEKTLGDKIAETAESYIGKVKYVKGGTSLTNGCDCTGFVQAIHKKCGITLKVSDTWGKSVGKDTSKAKAGDVIFYYINGSLHHMGIYVGNGKVVHNSTSHKDWHKDVCKSDAHMSGMKIGDIRRCWK